MSMKDAVLGLVVERRGYGYDLIRRFSERFGEAWQLNPSTIYASVDTLCQGGFVRGASQHPKQSSGSATPRRSNKIFYEATPLGVERFETWLTAPTQQVEPVRMEVLLKVGLGQAEYALGLTQMLDAQIDACADALGRHLSGYQLDATSTAATVSWQVAATWFANEAAIARYQADLAWLRRVRGAAESLRRNGTVPVAELTGLGGGLSRSA